MKRETLEEACRPLLDQPVGTRDTIDLYMKDDLTGLPEGVRPRGNQTRWVKVIVVEEKRRDGRVRKAVVEEFEKDVVVVGGPWA